ncbi:MAG: response regulator [Alphaproteobacteria bacterium]|nr:response regulator [Alphaproteobacteria bacterium]
MSPKSNRVIVVDDDTEMRNLLQRYLTGEGYTVRTAADGKTLDTALAREPADIIVLDLMMPGEDGLSICRRLRGAGDLTPIVMLTAKGDPIDRIVGLEMGADDYLPKPFTPRELLARMSAVLRRGNGSQRRATGEIIKFGPFEMQLAEMKLTRDGHAIELSSREFALLKALALEAGRPLSRARLIEMALGRDAEVTDRAIDVQISRLRKAIGDDTDDPHWIKTVWGVGYVLAGTGE